MSLYSTFSHAAPCRFWTASILGLAVTLQVAAGNPAQGQESAIHPNTQDVAAALDPSGTGWDSEVIAASIHDQLDSIGAFLEGKVGVEYVGAVLAHQVSFSTFTPDMDDSPGGNQSFFTVGRASVSTEDESEMGHGRPGFFAELKHWKSLVSGRAVETHFKVLGVSRVGDEWHTPVRVELRCEDGPLREWILAMWDCRWEVGPEVPQLLELEVATYVSSRSESPLFEDVTHSVLGGTGVLQQLLPSIPYWRERIDSYLGVGVLGHHGISVTDINGDGLEDVYICQPGGLPNRLFVRQAAGGYLERSAQAGVDVLDSCASSLFVDLDGDADPDLLLAVGDELLVMENLLGDRFVARKRLTAPSTTSLAAADIDLDGDLDVYVCAYLSPYDGESIPLPYHQARNGQPNQLLVNSGSFEFHDGTHDWGLDENNRSFSFVASFEDFDHDGDQDLYVVNDFGANQLYRNEGGRFEDVAFEYGVLDVGAGMGVDWADVNGDGWQDLYVSNMYSSAGKRVSTQAQFQSKAAPGVLAQLRDHSRGNRLFLNQSGQGFVDASELAGVAMGRWAWGGVALEFDNDGRLDLFVPNGFVTGESTGDL